MNAAPNRKNEDEMVGIDVVDLSRIDPDNESLMKKILTEEEYAVFSSIKNQKRKTEYAGGRFAVKEAIFKATQDRNWLSYSVLNDHSGKPYIKDHPEIEVSITHDGGIAAAAVFILSEQLSE